MSFRRRATHPSLTLAAFLVLVPLASAQEAPQDPAQAERERFERLFQGGVLMPYDAFLRALRGEVEAGPAPVREDRPPAGFALQGATITGTARDTVGAFEATFDVEVLDPRGWVQVPIGLKEAALESALVDGKPAIAGSNSDGYSVYLRGAGRHTITARFAVPVTTRPGISSLTMTMPRVALAKLELTVPQDGLRIGVANQLGRDALDVGSGSSGVRAWFGPAAQARLTWNPRPKRDRPVAKRDPLLFATTRTAVLVDEGALQVKARINYRINRAPCGRFVVRFPKGYRLLALNCSAVSFLPLPKPTQVAGEQEVVVQLGRPVAKAVQLDLELEHVLDEGVTSLTVPRLRTIGTQRENGVIAVRAGGYLTLEPSTRSGLSQLDAHRLPPVITQALAWNPKSKVRPPLAFRYQRQPYALSLKTGRIVAEVDGRLFALAMLKDDEIALATSVHYTVRKRGIFGVRVRLPQGYQHMNFGGEGLVNDYRIEDGVMSVDFGREIKPDPKGFNLTLFGLVRRPKPNDLNLRMPDLQPKRGAMVAFPRIELVDVKKASGVIAIGARKHLRLTLEKQTGLWPVPVQALPQHGFPFGPKRGVEDLTFGFHYGKPQGVGATFGVERREPKVEAHLETLVDAQPDQLRVRTTARYSVEFAGVEQVRIRVPQALGREGALEFERDGIREPSVAADPNDEQYAIWTVPLQGKRTGAFKLSFGYAIKLNDFPAGTQKRITLAEVQALDCFNVTADVALKKHENLVITESAMTRVEKRDKRELSGALRQVSGVQSAYRILGHPHRLDLVLTRYDFKTPLGILIRHLHQDDLVAKDGSVKTEATLSLQAKSDQQDLRVLLPPGAKFRGLKVDGRSVKWETGTAVADRPAIRVLLGDVDQARRGEAFQIKFRYDVPSAGSVSGFGTLRLAEVTFPHGKDGQVPINRATRSVYLPPGAAWLEFQSEGLQHFESTTLWDRLTGWFVPSSRPNRHLSAQAARSAEQAVARLKALAGGTHAATYQALDLPKKGRPYVFETLAGTSPIAIGYASWPLFYALVVLVFLGTVALGVFVDRKPRSLPVGLNIFLEGEQAFPPAIYPTLAAAVFLVLGLQVGRPFDAFCASGFVGAVGLGGYFLLRGVWRELSEAEAERRAEEHAQEANVAMERAKAAEAEANLAAEGSNAGA